MVGLVFCCWFSGSWNVSLDGMKLLIAIILFIAVFIWDLITDKKKFDKADYFFNHKKDWWLRLFLLTPSIVFFSLATNNFIWSLQLSAIKIGFYYWFLFDGIYNVYVEKINFFEVMGTVGSLDKRQHRIGSFGSFLIKAAGII